MEAMESYGWSLVDSNGVKASIMIFQNRGAADQYREEIESLHPERKCALVELFVRKEQS